MSPKEYLCQTFHFLTRKLHHYLAEKILPAVLPGILCR